MRFGLGLEPGSVGGCETIKISKLSIFLALPGCREVPFSFCLLFLLIGIPHAFVAFLLIN